MPASYPAGPFCSRKLTLPSYAFSQHLFCQQTQLTVNKTSAIYDCACSITIQASCDLGHIGLTNHCFSSACHDPTSLLRHSAPFIFHFESISLPSSIYLIHKTLFFQLIFKLTNDMNKCIPTSNKDRSCSFSYKH